MTKWKKILFDKSNKITKINKEKNFDEFSKGVEIDGYISNENYSSKNKFFNHYLHGRYLIWNDFLKNNLNPKEKTLSIASGRGINELALIVENFNVTCSDLKIPPCYDDSKKLFGNFDYKELDILKNKISDNFENIFCLSALYIFSDSELRKAFNNMNETLKKNGTLIIDIGGAENNFVSYTLHNLYLVIEAYSFYLLSKVFKKNTGVIFDNNFGYRRKNHEIIKMAEDNGFKLVKFEEYDYLTELQRSLLINKILKYFPFLKKIFILIGKSIPYIRFFKFKKI